MKNNVAGGANVTYWGQSQDGCEGERSACPCVAGDGSQLCPPSDVGGHSLAPAWTRGLRQGPPGEVQSCTDHGVVKRPGSDFIYSFANPAIAEGLLQATSGMGYAEYADRHVFPTLGIHRSEWRWLGDHEGNSQPDGGSFHTGRNYAKLAYLMLKGGKWEVNGTVQQVLDPGYVAGASRPTP